MNEGLLNNSIGIKRTNSYPVLKNYSSVVHENNQKVDYCSLGIPRARSYTQLEITLEHLLDAGPESLKDNEGNTVLMQAIKNNRSAIISDPSKKDCSNVDYKNFLDESALFLAAKMNNEKVITFLLNQGAGVNSRDSLGHTALSESISNGYKEVTSILLQKAVQLTPDNIYKAFIEAIIHNDNEAFEALINNLSDINRPDCLNFTPLMLAVHYERLDMVEKLLESRADVNVKNYNIDTGLDTETDKLTMNALASKVDEKGDRYVTALSLSIAQREYDIMALLLNYGATC